MVIQVLPPGFCRRPVSLRPSAFALSAFARQPLLVSLHPSAFIRQPSPVDLCSSAVPALVPSRFALAFGDGWRGVDGVALASLGLRDGFGFALGCAPSLCTSLAAEILGLTPGGKRFRVQSYSFSPPPLCDRMRCRANPCDKMLWGWKSGLLRRETNEYIFLLSNGKQLEQPLQL